MPSAKQPAAVALPPGAKARILAAATRLIAEGGSEAVTTRAVAEAASVQAPTIYRLFGDKQGLLDAVAEQAFARYVAGKSQRVPDSDPVEELRQGWKAHISFGLENPSVFALMCMPRSDGLSPAAAAGLDVLHARIHRIALTGRLRVTEERAVALLHAVGTGTVLTLLGTLPAKQVGLSDAAFESVLAAILDQPVRTPEGGPAGMAAALRACLNDIASLSPGERHLMGELLHRISEKA
ncbi:TetR/AcrR family transcriptional regulator [Roseomonas sp. WA12]